MAKKKGNPYHIKKGEHGGRFTSAEEGHAAAVSAARKAAKVPEKEMPPEYPNRKALQEWLMVDDVKKSKDGTFTIYRGFFYRHGQEVSSVEQHLMDVFPKAMILDSGERWEPFKGGASVRTSSHWWVKFMFPNDPNRKK